MMKDLCLGTNASMGGIQGGMSRGRKAVCPVCKRPIGMRPGRAGRLFPHSAVTDNPAREARALLRRLGATFEEYDSYQGLKGTVCSPPFKIWYATSCHSIAVNFFTDRPAGWRAVLEDAGKGLIDCDDPDCEMCEEDRLEAQNKINYSR